MQSIAEIKIPVPTSKATNERATCVEYFVVPLIEERRTENMKRYANWLVKNKGKTSEDFKKTKGYLKPLTAAKIAIMLSHIETPDLPSFFKRCLDYGRKNGNSFSRGFFGSLKVKK